VSEAEGMTPQKNRGQRDCRQQGEPEALAREHAPGRTCVADVDQIKESGNHLNLRARPVTAEGQAVGDHGLGDLIEYKKNDGEQPETPVSENSADSGLWILDFQFHGRTVVADAAGNRKSKNREPKI
jgi:hypothetical protein